MIDDKRHVPVLDAFISWAARLLNANETLIREMVHERAGWFVRFAGLDEKIADKILERSEEHTSELQSLMRISYAVFCLKKKIINTKKTTNITMSPMKCEHSM